MPPYHQHSVDDVDKSWLIGLAQIDSNQKDFFNAIVIMHSASVIGSF